MMAENFIEVERDRTNNFVRKRNSSDSTTDGEFLSSTPTDQSPSSLTSQGRKRSLDSFYSCESMSAGSEEASEESLPAPKKRRKSSGSGPSSKFRGVCRNRRKWQAVIWVNGKRKYLGTFKDVRSFLSTNLSE
jgi:hypothetical protein